MRSKERLIEVLESCTKNRVTWPTVFDIAAKCLHQLPRPPEPQDADFIMKQRFSLDSPHYVELLIETLAYIDKEAVL